MHPTNQIEEPLPISLNDLREQSNLSVRAYNVCERNGLDDLDKIFEFYSKNRSFAKLRNSGRKTNEELETICVYFMQTGDLFRDEELQEQINQNLKFAPENLTESQLNLMEDIVLQKFSKLSVRASNCIKTSTTENIKYGTLYEFFVKGEFLKIRNVGRKTAVEIEDFWGRIMEFFTEIAEHPDDKLVALGTAALFRQILNLPSDFMHPYLDEIKGKRFPLFGFLNALIVKNIFFEENWRVVLCHRYGYFNKHDPLSLDEIGEFLGITRERVRQISSALSIELDEKLNFIEKHCDRLHAITSYSIPFSKDIFCLHKPFAEEVNQSEGTRFSLKFLTKIIGRFCSNSHELHGTEQFDFFQNYYFINKELTDSFDFEALINDVRRQSEQRIDLEYSLDFEGYLFSFMKQGNEKLLSRIESVCEEVIIGEFVDSVFVDFSGNLVFGRNTKIRIHEFAYELLLQNGNPMKVADIHKSIQLRYPESEITVESVRSALNKEKFLFIFFGRSST